MTTETIQMVSLTSSYIDVGEDGERFLVIDMVKKKAERKAKPTPVLKVRGKKKK